MGSKLKDELGVESSKEKPTAPSQLTEEPVKEASSSGGGGGGVSGIFETLKKVITPELIKQTQSCYAFHLTGN